eukprot:855575-Rhodomonas_salina.1
MPFTLFPVHFVPRLRAIAFDLAVRFSTTKRSLSNSVLCCFGIKCTRLNLRAHVGFVTVKSESLKHRDPKERICMSRAGCRDA